MDKIKTLAGLLMRDKINSKKLKKNEFFFYFQGIVELIELINKTEHIRNIDHTLKTDEYLGKVKSHFLENLEFDPMLEGGK